MQRHVLAPAHAHPALEAIQAVEASHPFAIDRPAFAAEHHPDAEIAEPGTRVGDLPNAEAQGALVARPTRLVPRRAAELRQATGPHAADIKGVLKPLSQL